MQSAQKRAFPQLRPALPRRQVSLKMKEILGQFLPIFADPMAMTTLQKNSVLTDVAETSESQVHWEG